MPVILPEEHYDSWLSGECGKEVLAPYPADRMKAWPISARVNSPKNDDAEVILPVELQSVARPQDSQQPQLLRCLRSDREQSGCYTLVLLQPKPLPSYIVVTQQNGFALARTPRQHERQIFLPPIKVHTENGAHVH
jgi:hypothetical protein